MNVGNIEGGMEEMCVKLWTHLRWKEGLVCIRDARKEVAVQVG